MALAFVLSIDEMVFERLATLAAKHIMQNLENLALFDTNEEENETDSEVLERFYREEVARGKLGILAVILPKRLLSILLLLALFVFKYYTFNCQRSEDGSYVSNPIHLPADVRYNPLSFVYGFFLSESEHPVWTMPDTDPG